MRRGSARWEGGREGGERDRCRCRCSLQKKSSFVIGMYLSLLLPPVLLLLATCYLLLVLVLLALVCWRCQSG